MPDDGRKQKGNMKPLRFKELLLPTIWGGEDIVELKGLQGRMEDIGESWEISGVAGKETPVTGGEDDGLTLAELIERYGASLVGRRNLERYGTTFPLLVKFISAANSLSVQVHPDDAMARRMGHPYGKTEMWYIVKTAPWASLCSGFKHDFSAEAYTDSLAEGTLTSHLAYHDTHPGDCFFIPAGRIHCIGAGNFLVEIQQSSNDTFRVYDFDRVDDLGNKRELHVEQARKALNYKAEPNYRTQYEPHPGQPVVLVNCPEFTVRLLQSAGEMTVDYAGIDSFVIYVAYEGKAMLTDSEGNELMLEAGQSVLFPAVNAAVRIEPVGNAGFSCLETFVK